jgi:U3 small nucleolar RNA-associated protein 13
LAASASQDRTVHLWSLEGGALKDIGVLKGHKRAVWCVNFPPVDKLVASGSGDMLIKIWSIEDLTCMRTLEGHLSSVLRLHWVANGFQLLSSGSDGLIKLWSAKSGECTCTLDAHEDKIWALDVCETAASSSSTAAKPAVEDDDEEAEGGGTLEVWSGSADSVLVRWRDSSEAVAKEESKARDLRMQQEQDLTIAVHTKQYEAALKLAMRLRHPRSLRQVVEKLVDTPEGSLQLQAAVGAMEGDEIAHCLSCVRDWNTTAQHALTAQKLLHAVLKSTPQSQIASIPQLKETLEALIPYTERHFERLDRLSQGAQFVGFTLSGMRVDAEASQ